MSGGGPPHARQAIYPVPKDLDRGIDTSPANRAASTNGGWVPSI